MNRTRIRMVLGGGVAAGLLAAGGVARAQTPSDLQPPSQPAPTALPNGGYWVPGMPTLGGNSVNNPMTPSGALRTTERPRAGNGAPAAAAPTERAANAGRGEAVYDPMEIEGPITVSDPHAGEGPVPETHRVQKGDTLWGISSAYFQSPWYWPKLWALNPLVTNPHWIYPGDVIRLRQPTPTAASPAATPAAEVAPPPRILRGGPVADVGLRQTGFVEQGDLKASAKIVGSREEKVLLSTLDEAYVEFSKRDPLVAGERYSIYRVVSEVKAPGSRQVIGSIVEILGDVEVRSVGENRIAKAVIVEALNPIERGFRVGPLRRRFSLAEPVASTQDLSAQVVAAIRPTDLVGEAMLVFLDRGKDDGVAVGNRFLVVRRGDGIQPLLARKNKDDDRFPQEILGEAQVVEVRGQTSTAMVLRSTRELSIGDVVKARKGY